MEEILCNKIWGWSFGWVLYVFKWVEFRITVVNYRKWREWSKKWKIIKILKDMLNVYMYIN